MNGPPRSGPLVGVGLRAAASVLLAVTLLPAAAAQAQQGPDQAARGVEGPKWQLVKYRTDGELQLVPPGVGAEAILWAGVVGGTGACSPFASTYTLARDLLRIAPPEIESRDCVAEAEALDELFFAHLADTASWAVDGSQMELLGATGEPLLTFTKATIPDDPTVAPWQLSSVAGADGVASPAVQGSDAGLLFLPGGRVVGRSGCGSLLGSYTTNGTTIDITDVESRVTDCSGEIREQAALLLEALPEVSDFALRPAGLSLADESGATRLEFVPNIPLTQRSWTPTEVMSPEGEVLLVPQDLDNSSLRFGASKVDGRSVCRAYAGSTLRSGLALTVFDLTVAGGSCRHEELEAAYLQALRDVASHALRGRRLELLDQEGRIRVRLRPQSPLMGVDWQLSRIDTSSGRKARMKPPVTEAPLRATFVEDGVLVGSTGLNRFDATYEAGGSQISISEPKPTPQVNCRRRANRGLAACRLEARYLELLDRVDQYVVYDNQLKLYEGSRQLLEFRPAANTVEAATETEEAATETEEPAGRSRDRA